MAKRFLVNLEYDSDYDGYVASVPSMPGCMSQGKTRNEALANIEDAIRGYLESLADSGQALPSGDGEVYTIEVAA